ncbi:MAG: hypothetical protein V4574_04665 [Pseudomonadota bacterium]
MSMWVPLIAVMLAQTAPSAEAEALGVRLAETGTLAALLPVVVAKDREALIAEHPELGEADKAALRATADEVASAGIARLMAAIGHGYAAKIPVEELRALVAFNETPAARHWREATPEAVAQALATVGEMDFKGDTRKAYCAKTGKLCAE